MTDPGSEPQRVAPAFGTGGGGFEFEDVVGAWLASALVAGAAPIGVEIGVPHEIRFQASASGWALDDVVVTGEGDREPRWSSSVKSFDMLTGSRLPAEFVETAWHEIVRRRFRPGIDHIGFVCGSAAQGNWMALLRLIGDAAADVDGIADRIAVEGAFNDTERSLWRSCECPPALAEQHGVTVRSSPARLLAALLPRRLDLQEPGADALGQALQWCRSALAAEQSDREQELWEALCALVSGIRPRGGALGWALIVARLGPRFAFRLRPDVAPDWELLAEHTATALAGVRDLLAQRIALPRTEAWTALQSGSESAAVTFLFGPSGCGKTALAKRWLTDGDHDVVWLSSADLDQGLTGLRARLALRLGVEKVLSLAPDRARVVIDGLDRSYRREHFAAAAALARLAGESGGRLQLLITAQQMELARVSRQLAEVNAPAATSISIGDLDDADVATVLREQPQLARVAVGGQLQTVLRRPKLLDLVLRAGGSSAETLARITDEAAVAALWWQHFVLGGAGAATRQELLLALAERQADRMLPWTPAGELSPADVERADALRQDGVLDEDRSRYAFAHDLFADWTLLQRLRALGSSALGQLGVKAELPAWHRAIRLLALTTLREDGVAAWSLQRAALDAGDHRVLADLFLDAALFADDAAALLRTLWPQLIADQGDLLRRLLRRFLYVATVPDPRGAVIFGDSAELAAHWAVQARVPLWPLWLPMLEVLHAERGSALAAAPAQVASVADLWLRHTREDWPLRDLAAAIALAAGRFVVERSSEGWALDDEFEAGLWHASLAAGALDPVSVLALVEEVLEPSDATEGSGELSAGVDREGLRTTILDGDALVPMIGADPQAAGALAIRAAIDPDVRERFSLEDVSLGITTALHWAAPLPERGPFLSLLVKAAAVGVESVLTLAEHATRRWAQEPVSAVAPRPPSAQATEADRFEVVIGGETVELVGDAEMMHWYRGEGRVPAVLSSAMMALEWYLYRQLDAGEDISAMLDRLKQSRSLAVWGLLVEIARYQPELLRGPLSPIVTSAALLLADRLYTNHDHSHLLISTLAEQAAAERIRSWNKMAHRQVPVIDFVMRDVVTGAALVQELTDARRRWEESDAERWRHLLAQTNTANYRITERAGGALMVEYVPPAALAPEVAESQRQLAETDFWLMLPYRLREWIDAGSRPPDDELEQVWTDLHERLEQPAAASHFEDGVRSRADVECGIAALFVICARDWLRARPDREEWCRRVLLAPFENPPVGHMFDSPVESSTERWDVFCADALPRLLAEAPEDLALRSAVVRLAVNPHYITVSRTFDEVARHRALVADLHRLEHLSLVWARFSSWRHELRHREETARHGFGAVPTPEALPDLRTPTREAVDAFTAGTLPAEVPRLADWVAATPKEMLPGAGRRRELSAVDLGYLLSARNHFAEPLDGLPADERRRRLAFAGDLAALIAGALAPDEGGRVQGTPYTEERRALSLLAWVTVEGNVEEVRPIWEPLLRAGGPAHYWVESYLNSVWRSALAPQRWPEAFPGLVKEMLAFASAADTWHGRRAETDLSLAIVGLDRWGQRQVHARHAELVRALQPEWAEWVGARMRDPWFARRAVGFLAEPAADPVREKALGWLADRERSVARVDSDLDTAIADLLLGISIQQPELLRGPGEAAACARYLLARLTGRGIVLALELSAGLA